MPPSSPAIAVPESARALLAGAVDYAGLFPPAGLGMPGAIAEYAAARTGADQWMLGRFVVPAARLDELAAGLPVPGDAPAAWRLSAIVAFDAPGGLDAVAAFNASAARRHAVVDAIECKPRTLADLDPLGATAAAGIDVYVEIDPAGEPAAWFDRLAARGLRAKIRTGGTTAAAFPEPAAVAAFLAAAVRTGVPFKATAGLHHAVRGAYRLTYDDDAASAPMYGYLNVLLATTALRMGRPARAVADILTRADDSTLAFLPAGVRWGVEDFPTAELRHTRAQLAGFGSCSFREPAGELRSLIHPSR